MIIRSINLLKVCGSRSQTRSMFCLILKQIILRQIIRSINLPKVCGLRDQAWLRFCLIFRKMIIKIINLPKVCGPRSQAWPMFCLILKQIINVTHSIINKNMVEMPFINNNTFVGYLHSRGVVQYFHLDLSGNTHLFQPSRWYNMILPNWALAFPMLGSS